MKWLNYNHLYYFWMVAREGSVVRASEELMVSQPTISSQLKDLEAALRMKLFDRAGRGLALTDAGRIAMNYANEIFSLGEELLDALEQNPGAAAPALKLAVGVLDVIPKAVARRLLAPAMRLDQPVRLVCREDKADRLLADLAARRTHMILSDSPIGTAVPFQGFNHLLGQSKVSFFATRGLAQRFRSGFPRSLNGAPFLLPTDHTAMRRSLNLWFERRRIHPLVVGEFDDGAAMLSFGQDGAGVFPAPSVVGRQIQRERGVQVIGEADKVRESYYAISVEEFPSHPGVMAICETASRALSS